MNSSTFPIPISRARSILSDWGISNPQEIDLDLIAAELGILIVEKDIAGSAARLVCVGRSAIISINQHIREVGRKRFAIAHELGHFILHKHQTPGTICTEESFFTWYNQSVGVKEANVFAAELLMPESLFREHIVKTTPDLKTVQRLSGEFNTTLTATAIRYVELGELPCAIFASCAGKVKWFSASQNFPYKLIKPGSNLHEYSCANDFFKNGSAPSEPETVQAVAWFENYEKGSRCYLYEQAIPLPLYNTVLSLIWIREDQNRSTEFEYCESPLDPEKFTPDGKRYRW